MQGSFAPPDWVVAKRHGGVVARDAGFTVRPVLDKTVRLLSNHLRNVVRHANVRFLSTLEVLFAARFRLARPAPVLAFASLSAERGSTDNASGNTNNGSIRAKATFMHPTHRMHLVGYVLRSLRVMTIR